MPGRSDPPGAADSSPSINASTDRRVARGDHTRTILCEAMIELIMEENSRPTVSQVADRAGTSVRTVFNHFQIDALFGLAAALLVSRHRQLVAMVPPKGPVEARIRAVCRQRRQFFEAIGPLIRVAQVRAGSSPELNQVLWDLESFLQRQVAATFGPEISSDGRDPPLLLEHIDLVTSWRTWDVIRNRPVRSATAAELAMAVFVTRLLVHPISGSPTKVSR